MEDEFSKILDFVSGKTEYNTCIETTPEFNEICSRCNKNSVAFNGGLCICTNPSCGIILGHNIKPDQEWRYYGNLDNKSSDPTRVGMPTNELLPKSSLGSVISNKYRTSSFNRLRQYQQWNSMPYKERSLWNIYSKIQLQAGNAGISKNVIDKAKALYKTISETRISRGSNRLALEAACIYMACKMHNVPRTAKEIAEIFGLDLSVMTKGVKNFSIIMNQNKSHNFNIQVKATNPTDYIDRYCSSIEVSDFIIDKCKQVSSKAHELDIVDENTPSSIAAGSIFLVATEYNLPITKKQIKEACKVSEVTISKCYKKLEKYKKYLL